MACGRAGVHVGRREARVDRDSTFDEVARQISFSCPEVQFFSVPSFPLALRASERGSPLGGSPGRRVFTALSGPTKDQSTSRVAFPFSAPPRVASPAAAARCGVSSLVTRARSAACLSLCEPSPNLPRRNAQWPMRHTTMINRMAHGLVHVSWGAVLGRRFRLLRIAIRRQREDTVRSVIFTACMMYLPSRVLHTCIPTARPFDSTVPGARQPCACLSPLTQLYR